MPELLSKWKRERVTTNLSGDNAACLQSLSSELGVPLGRIIDQALDEFFMSVGVRDSRSTTPYDKEHIKEMIQRRDGTDG